MQQTFETTEPRNAYEEKKQAKIERYRGLADKNREKADNLWTESNRMADVIPFGQPILVGHHSEKGDRRYRERIHNKMNKSFETREKADYYDRRAEAAENNNAISSDDPEALQKLTIKIKQLEANQERYKQINKIAKSHRKNYSDEEKINDLCIKIELSEETAKKILQPDYCGRVGIADYTLTNNSSNIRRLKKRMEKLEKMSSQESTETQLSGGISIIDNVDENRIQVFFPGKPAEEIRKTMKSQGFRWSPSNGCWQAYRDDWKLKRIKEILS